MKLSGYTVTRDCVSGDYCFEECIRSLSAICDEVVVADAMSEDGTRERIASLVCELGNVRVVNYPREDLFNDRGFFTRWLNYTRLQLTGDIQLQLDADEVFDTDSRDYIRMLAEHGRPYWCRRLNFWGDHRHYAPSGVVCGDRVVRLAPARYWMPSDEGHVPEVPIRLDARDGGPVVYHYGFIRHANGFLKKSEWFQQALVGDFDKRLKRAKETGEDWRILAPCPATPVPYNGPHPRIAHNWLRARGYIP